MWSKAQRSRGTGLTPIGIIRRSIREPIGRPEQPVGEEEDGEGRRDRVNETRKENCDGVEAFLDGRTATTSLPSTSNKIISR